MRPSTVIFWDDSFNLNPWASLGPPTALSKVTYHRHDRARVRIGGGETAPSLVITFDEDLAAAASLANSAFTVKKTASGGSEATVALSTTVAPVISGTTVTLTLDHGAGVHRRQRQGDLHQTHDGQRQQAGRCRRQRDGDLHRPDRDQQHAPAAASCTAPSFGTRRNIWTGSLTVGSATGVVGFQGTTGALDDKTFSIGSSNHEIDGLFLDVRNAGHETLFFSLKDTDLTSAEQAALRLHVCNTAYDISTATLGSAQHNYNLDYSGAAWTSGSTLAVYLSLPPNNAATGAPTISGAALVGETLMAATGTIADADGVPTTLTYQWLRVDGANETDIPGETQSSYTVSAADIGKTLKVKVGFTDNLSGEESRSSAATATVAQPPTVSIAAVYPKATMRIANPEFTVTISAAQTSAVTVNLSIAQAAGYLSSTTQSIEIQANQTSATKKFSGFYTGTTSGDLTATVVAGPGYVPAATPANAATVEVVSPGNAGILSYFWAEAAYSVDEGDSVDVVVTLRTAANVPKPRESFLIYGMVTAVLTGEGDMATQGALVTGAGGDYTHTSESGGAFAPDAWSADGAVFTATKTHTIQTTEDSAYEGNERFKIVLARGPGGVGSKGSPGETIVTIVDDEALKVTGVAVTSTPNALSTYGAGETISFTATFNGPVTVTGTPQLPFTLGGVTQQAAYASGSDSAALVFSYTVAAGDNDADGVSWAADALSLNGGAIKFMTGVVANRVDAALTHAAKTAESGHKVDTPPVLSTRTVNGAALVLTYNEALDTGSEPASSAFTVKVGGTAVSLASSGAVAVAGSTVTLTLAAAVAASDTVTVSYAVPGSNPLQDAGGTDAPAFADLAVTNGTGNTAPAFANATAARSFTETVGDAAVATAGNVGAVVTATDADADTLTYSLEGADAAKFGIVSGSGQIQTRAGQKYDRETKVSYSVTVKADDGNGGADTVAVTITLTNAVEIPLAPGMPAVSATSGNTTSLDVRWSAPANTGRPALSGYKLQYRQGSSGGWTDHAHSGTGTSATIAGLTPSDRLRGAGARSERRRRRGVVGLGHGHDRFPVQQRAGIFRHHGGAQLHRDGGRCNRGCRARRGRRGDGDRRRRGHAHLLPGGGGRGEVRHRLHQRADPDQGGREIRPGGEGELLGDGEGRRQQRRDGHRGGDDYPRRRGREAAGAGHAGGVGDLGQHDEPGRELDGAGERGAPGAIGLQAAIPAGQQRRLDGPCAFGHRHERDHRRPDGGDGPTRCRCAQ